MKVLTVKQPYASLIAFGYKTFEFRSWQTKYRGEIYIHAGFNIDNAPTSLVEDYDINYLKGAIIAKAKLIDCILVDEKMNKKLNKMNSKIYWNNYKGYYAWVLKDIELIKPIKAKGQLGIWNYYNELEIMGLMDNIKYGFVGKDKNKYVDNNLFNKLYYLPTPKEIIKNKVGICWDQVELERYYFKNHDLDIQTYFIIYNDNALCPTHTFLTYKKNNKFYWFEHAYEKYKGIHEYCSLKVLLKDVKNKFLNDIPNNKIENIEIYNYGKPSKYVNCMEFIDFCKNGKLIKL